MSGCDGRGKRGIQFRHLHPIDVLTAMSVWHPEREFLGIPKHGPEAGIDLETRQHVSCLLAGSGILSISDVSNAPIYVQVLPDMVVWAFISHVYWSWVKEEFTSRGALAPNGAATIVAWPHILGERPHQKSTRDWEARPSNVVNFATGNHKNEGFLPKWSSMVRPVQGPICMVT